VLSQSFFTPNQIQRRALLRSGLGENESSGWEVERPQAELAGNFCAGGLPVETTGNHQVYYKEEISFQLEDDAFPETAQPENFSAKGFTYRRIDGAKKKRTCDPNPLERLAQDAPLQRLYIFNNIREFWHPYLPCGALGVGVMKR